VLLPVDGTGPTIGTRGGPAADPYHVPGDRRVTTIRRPHRVVGHVTLPPPVPEGFAEFVAARSFALLSTAWLLTGDEGRAEDLLQEALARTWQAWPRIRHAGGPEPYVRKVMVNLNVSWWRRRWRGERPQAVLPEPLGPDPLGPDPTAQVDVRDAVRRALATLPPRQRAVLVLRYVEDWTEAQTATALGCSVGTVKSQAHRAIARLRTDPQITALMTTHSLPRGAS